MVGESRSMKIVGYADRFSVAAEETIRFMVSCELPQYRADIVRLIHGDPNPRGPGVKEELIATAVSGEYAGRRQALHKGFRTEMRADMITKPALAVFRFPLAMRSEERRVGKECRL